MKTPYLIDVPQTHPTRKQRIAQFKKLNGIETYAAGFSGDEFPCWIAAHMPSVYTLGYGVKEGMEIAECFSLVCRLIEEAGYCAEGHTEAEAIRNLCGQVNIICTI